jgi:hypothetical protein
MESKILQYLVCRCFRDVNFLVINPQNLKAGLMHLMESRFDEHLFLKRSSLKLSIFTATESPVRLLQNAKIVWHLTGDGDECKTFLLRERIRKLSLYVWCMSACLCIEARWGERRGVGVLLSMCDSGARFLSVKLNGVKTTCFSFLNFI